MSGETLSEAYLNKGWVGFWGGRLSGQATLATAGPRGVRRKAGGGPRGTVGSTK